MTGFAAGFGEFFVPHGVVRGRDWQALCLARLRVAQDTPGD
jgi:hypothetical protein